MTAIVCIDGKEIKTEGMDLTIVTNTMFNEVFILDRASDRHIFSCRLGVVDYAYIVDSGDAERLVKKDGDAE